MASEHPRLRLDGFLSPDLCKELEFIHRSCGTVGYRPSVLSTTLSHLIATNCAHLILPFVSIRERLKETAEAFFGCEFELFVEFTGLISWCKGAYIGWHSDDNRPYLKQRDFAAVCYLNSCGKDFKGGHFHFKDGEPSTVIPIAGDVLIYTADSRNIHSVDEVVDGERLTLTLWFTHNSAHDEDAKLISLLSQNLLSRKYEKPGVYSPLPASENMYWFSQDEVGFDLRCARAHNLGFKLCPSSTKYCTPRDSSDDASELLIKPLRLCREVEIFDKEFSNSLHALQVVQFYRWKAPELAAFRRKTGCNMQPFVLVKLDGSEMMLPCNDQLAETVVGRISSDDEELLFTWDDFALATARWEEYTNLLHKDLLTHLPYWVSHQTIFSVNPCELSD